MEWKTVKQGILFWSIWHWGWEVTDTPPKTATCCQCLLLSDFFQQPTLANSLPNYPGSVDKSGDRRERHLPVPISGTIFYPTFYGRHWNAKHSFNPQKKICSKMLKRNLRNKEQPLKSRGSCLDLLAAYGHRFEKQCHVLLSVYGSLPWQPSGLVRSFLNPQRSKRRFSKKTKSPWHPVDVWMDGCMNVYCMHAACMHVYMYTYRYVEVCRYVYDTKHNPIWPLRLVKDFSSHKHGWSNNIAG